MALLWAKLIGVRPIFGIQPISLPYATAYGRHRIGTVATVPERDFSGPFPLLHLDDDSFTRLAIRIPLVRLGIVRTLQENLAVSCLIPTERSRLEIGHLLTSGNRFLQGLLALEVLVRVHG